MQYGTTDQSIKDEQEEEALQGKLVMFIIHLTYMLVLLVFIGFQQLISKYETKNPRNLSNIKDYAVLVHGIDKNYGGNLINDVRQTMNMMFDGGW